MIPRVHEEAPFKGRVLFVHAHPDDETISSGGMLAALSEQGVQVSLLTLTRGELGEVIPEELRHLQGSPDLAPRREAELRAALQALGVSDHRYLGERDARWADLPPRRYEDSGMRWAEPGRAEPLDAVSASSLCGAPLAEVATDIAAAIAALQPDAVVSYDADGGYGHPDHVRAHQASRLAADAAGVPFWVIEPARGEAPAADGFAQPVPDDAVPIDARGVRERVTAALHAHRTQLQPVDGGFALSNGTRIPMPDIEYVRPLDPADPPAVVARSKSPKAAPPAALAAGALTVFGGLLIGAVMGALGTAAHQAVPPWGIALSLVMVASVLAALRALNETRLAAVAASVGLMVVIVMLATPGAGGSAFIPATPAGYAWTFGPAVVAFIALAWPRLGRSTRE
ncbi:PIG-L family deacetylase [Ruicaihuangia caeni]|uniref:PIG-L family deacetylase n=1 Tax=Ruicaihuangia caeni TaxID=3042517 RepID=A0AAW6TCC1_9MICO|nr:PIG-L family deacetylase [Klugiella sp. YN-L-19]MDI2099653.1 PIG-L family deacetylase [Klugiella sp. YN-L-19]